jgi:hypothetical protein
MDGQYEQSMASPDPGWMPARPSQPAVRRRMPALRSGLMIALWLGTLSGSTALVWRYMSTPGRAAEAPAAWPSGTRISRTGGRFTLVMLAHPHCPCTRASIAELRTVMGGAGQGLDAHVLFLEPADRPRSWTRTDLWTNAAAIPGVAVSGDPGGVEAGRFGATTSGQTLLFDPNGSLLFAGGITGARGHEGDSSGRRRLLALLRGASPDRRDSPVFGCSLVDPAQADPSGEQGRR